MGLVAFCLMFYACRKESFTNSSADLLSTTADSLHFDTVFTSAGSITQMVKVVNPNAKSIRLSSVTLGGGATSPFKINVDGVPGPNISNVEVGAKDSTYIFVTVTINPNSSNLAFIVSDSVKLEYNGNVKFIQLRAYGQNAHFFRNRRITANETWDNDLPYLILDKLTVDTTATLTINKGCRIFMHANAPLVVNGSLIVNGERFDSTRVIFTGDRLDEPYRNYPASYPGLVFNEISHNNVLTYAVIKNAYQGIAVTGLPSGTKLTLNETVIDNAFDAGLLGINTSINARNLQVSNCGKSIFLVKGGNYNFTHCTVAAFSNSFVTHREPALVITNFLNENNLPVIRDLNASFRNCIFWGEANGFVNDEVVVLKQGSSVFNIGFDQALWRVQTPPANASLLGIINNQNPAFDSVNNSQRIYNFNLKPNSPALNKGATTPVTTDLRGLPRPVGLPDLGAYERQ